MHKILNIDTAEQSFKAIFYLLTFLLIISIAEGTDWNQYLPSPTTNNLIGILSLSNGNAFAYTSGLGNAYLYNASGWQEIALPSATINLTGTPYFKNANKIKNGLVILAFGSVNLASSGYMNIVSYNAISNTYALITTTTNDFYYSSKIGCVYEDNQCYLGFIFGSYGIYKVYPSYAFLVNTTISPYPLSSENKLTVWISSTNNIREWNGISLISRGGTGTSSAKHLYLSSSQRAISDGSTLYWYNYTSGLFYSGLTTTITGYTRIDNDVWWFYNNKFRYATFNNNNYTNSSTYSGTLNSIDYDYLSGMGWAVGNTGVIYQYGTGGGTTTFTVTPRINPQPTTYGNQVIFYGKAEYYLPTNSNLTLEIWDANFTTLYYTTQVNNVPNGIETEIFRLNTNDIRWTNYQPNNYIYNLQATLTDNSATLSNSIIWNVTIGATTNQTNYKATCYNKQPDDTGYNGIYTLTAYDEDNVYTSIKNGGNISIASWDTNNPSNIIYSRLNPALNQQSGRNGNPTSISAIDLLTGADTIYIGTNDDLFLYTNASNKKAEGLVYEFDKGFGILQNDGITDVSAKNSDYAYVCQDGSGLIDDDDIYLYNKTLADFQDQMNMNPCVSLKYDAWIYAHRGYNYDVQIWNPTNQSLASTIDFTKTISTRAYNDLLDINNNYLSFIAGKDEIRRYDVTNHTLPVLAGKCFTKETNEEIESIESINNNEVIIGVYNPTDHVDRLYACDFGNSETYNTGKGGYEAQHLSGLSGDRAWEIIKNNNEGKISIAEGNLYEVCYYEKTNESITINNAPIIDNYTLTPTPPICLNQPIQTEIFAHDQDPTDYLQYGVSCSGGGTPTTWSAYNLLTCSYSTTGTKTITIQVKDNWGLPSIATYDTITVNNCNITNSTTLYFKIISGETTQPIESAIISIYNNQIFITQTTTNNNGYADFTGLTPNLLYRVTFVANGYAPKTEYFYTSGIRYTKALDLTTINGTTRTLLIVTVTNNSNSPIENALVSTIDPLTGSSKYGLTDYTGTIYLFDIQPSQNFIVGAKKDGYATTSIYASIGNGEQKIVNIIMGTTKPSGGFYPATPRQCADTISGVILCGNLSTTGIGNTCTQDTDCISGRCSFGLSIRECSKFNYTLCDNQGINRGNTCIFRNVTMGILKGIGNFIIDEFLYVLIIVLLIVAGLIIRRSLMH